jgi:hypothetical protein
MDHWDFASKYIVMVEDCAGCERAEVYVEVKTTRIVRISSEQFNERARRLHLPPHVTTFVQPPALIVKRVNYVARRLPLSDTEEE